MLAFPQLFIVDAPNLAWWWVTLDDVIVFRRPAVASGVCGALALALISVGPVAAQTASQITPPSLEPERQRLGGAVVFSGAPGLDAPAGAERLAVTIADVTVESGLPQMAEAHRGIEERLVGRPVPVSEIFEAAQDLETAYAREGFVLARVVLPAQTLRDGGSLRLVVVNGFVERADLANVPARVRPRIDTVTAPLVGRPGLTLGDIERRVLTAGETPGVALDTALSPGLRPGGTVLTFDAEYRSLTGYVAIDNTLTDELGDWAVSGGLEANSYFGLGEVIYLRAAGHPGGDISDDIGGVFGEYPQMRSLAAGAVVPIGRDGLTFNIEAVQSNTTPELSGVQTASEFERVSFRLRYPWLLTRTYALGTELILDLQSEELDLIEEDGEVLPLSEDELTVLRLAVDGSRQFRWGGAVQAQAILSVGLDALGARTAEDATPVLPLSRQGADAEFTKLEIAASYSQALNEHLAFSVYGRGQTSFGDPLLRSEQFGIASFSELSTFDAGTLAGDSGWLVRAEVLSPWALDSATLPFESVTPYAFAAVGEVYLEEPTAQETSSLGAASIGIGVELLSVFDPAYSDATLIVEYGRAFRDDDIDDENRFTLVGSYRF